MAKETQELTAAEQLVAQAEAELAATVVEVPASTPDVETPLQAAMRKHGVDNMADLQKAQAAARGGALPTAVAGVPVAPSVEPSAPKPPRAPRKPRTAVPQDESPLALAAAQQGVDSIEELQRKQAADRTAALPQTEPAAAVATPLGEMDLHELATEVRRLEEEEAVLAGKVSRAAARVQEIRATIDNLRAKITAATTVSEAETNRQYLEGSKRMMQERFAQQLAARRALQEADPNLRADMDALGLGKSPIDRAIANELTGKRRAESQAALQASLAAKKS
jgi:hypothetical protein